MRGVLVSLIAQIGVAIPVAGQARSLIPQPVHPSACFEGLAAMGLTHAPSLNYIRMAYDSIRDSSIALFDPPPSLSLKDGVQSVTGIAHYPGRAPSALAFLQLNFLVHSPAARSAAERQVAFDLSDSTHLTIGTASAYPSSLPHGPGVLEYIFIMVPSDDALRIARAATPHGRLGETAFDPTPAELDGLRALILYVRCGGQ